VAISIQRFAPTPTAKLGLGLDVAVLAIAVFRAVDGPIALRLAWVGVAGIVFWSTTSVVRHYAYSIERAAWEDVLFALMNVLAVATVIGVGGRLLHVRWPDVGQILLLALPAQLLLRLTVFAFVRAQTRPPREVLIIGTGPLGRITGEDLGRRHSRRSYLSWPGERVPEPLRGLYLVEAIDLPAVLQR